MLNINESMVAERTFCFLLGAGASAPAGIPPMQRLGDKFRERIAARSPSLAKVFDLVPREPEFTDWHERNNIETLLSFLYAAADLNRDPAGELPGDVDAFFNGKAIDEPVALRQQHARLCAILALQACSFILGEASHYARGRAYLAKLRNFVRSDSPLDVCSLNYDTVIEDFCGDHGIRCIDGFDTDGFWRPSIFYERSDAAQSLRLWKLHGSVTWVQDAATKQPRKAPPPGTWERRVLTGHSSSPTTETNLIYPGLGKTAVGPMRLLFAGFAERIRRRDCRLLIAVGYSFADDDVRDLVLEAMVSNSNLHLVVLSGNSSDRHVRRLVAYRPELRERIQPLASRFEVALEDGSIEEVIRDLITRPDVVRHEKHSQPLTHTDGDDAGSQMPVKLPAIPVGLRASGRVREERILCPGKFKCVRHLHPAQPGILLLTDNATRDSTRLLALDMSGSRLDAICTWFGEGTKFAVTDGRIATVADTKVRNFQFGVGTYWHVDLATGKRSPLLCERMLDAGELEDIARTQHRPTSDAEQSSGLEDYGIVSWPTAIESIPNKDSFLLVMSGGILGVKRGQAPVSWQRFPNCTFLNLTIVAHLNEGRYLLLETVRGAQGVLWEVDIDTPEAAPKFLAGGFREPAGLAVLPNSRHILVTESFPDAKGRLWRIDLASACEADLLRDDLDGPGEMVLLSEHSLAMITQDALREIYF